MQTKELLDRSNSCGKDNIMKNLKLAPFGRGIIICTFVVIGFAKHAHSQEIREYTVKRTGTPLTIDGQLTEPEWEAAVLTEPFVKQQDGSAMTWNTRAKFLWDDQYLYVGFLCDDPDVWSTFTQRDAYLWNEEVVEILCDPNDDKINYFEIQVNPLGTVVDLFMNKAYYAGGNANFDWNLVNLKTAVWVDGTVNDVSDVDSMWSCEVAIAYQDIETLISPLSIPPQAGESWRIQPTRYNRPRDQQGTVIDPPETSAWNQTSNASFHVPEKFGRIIFSDELITSTNVTEQKTNLSVARNRIIRNYPNPFNTHTMIELDLQETYQVTITIYDNLGREINRLFHGHYHAGSHRITWDGTDNNNNALASGIYIVKIKTKNIVQSKKVMLLR